MPQPLLTSLREADASLSALEALWPTLSERLTALSGQLVTAERQLQTLSGALQLWQENSVEWERQSQDWQGALTTARSSLDELTRRYAALSQVYSAQAALLERTARSRDVWRGVALGAAVVAVLAVVVAAVR